MKIKIANKRWDQKRGDNSKDVKLSNNIHKRRDEKVSQNASEQEKGHHNVLNVLGKNDDKRNVNNDHSFDSSIDMFTILS